MKALTTITAAVLCVGAAYSQTPAERDRALKYLQQTRDGVNAAVKGLSEAQLKFKPAPDRWSVAETLEHITKSEDFLFQNITDTVMKAPAPPSGRDNAKIDAFVLAAIPDRSRKAQAPAPLVPGSQSTPAETLDHFSKSREKTIAFTQAGTSLREHAIDSPLGQQLDGYQWLLFIAAHSERHTKQMLEVKADPNFPKS